MSWHVHPVLDIKQHDTETHLCHCHPRIEWLDNGEMLVIHNSYDGREQHEIEKGAQDLKQKAKEWNNSQS